MKKIIAFIALAMLAACNSTPAPYVSQPWNFVSNGVFNRDPIRVNVAEVRVVDTYQSPMFAPNVEHEFPNPPAAAIREWVRQRMQAGGAQGILEISIDDASARESLLNPTSGMFSSSQQAQIDASIRVTMRLYNGYDAIAVATGDMVITRSRSLDTKTDPNDRKRFYDQLVRDMMVTFEDQTNARLNQYFAPYLIK